MLAALDEIATAHNAAVATIALAWLAAQPTVAAPIASARTTAQLPDLLRVSDLRLSDAEIRKLNEASAPSGKQRDRFLTKNGSTAAKAGVTARTFDLDEGV